MNEKIKKGRRVRARKRNWSMVDAVLILLIAVAIAGVILRVVDINRQAENAGDVSSMYAVYFEVEETHEDVLASVQGFEAVYLLENDAHIGYVAVYEDADTGAYHPALNMAPAEGAEGDRRVVATGCLIATDVRVIEENLRVGKTGTYIAPGTRLEVRTDCARFTLRITEILPHG